MKTIDVGPCCEIHTANDRKWLIDCKTYDLLTSNYTTAYIDIFVQVENLSDYK